MSSNFLSLRGCARRGRLAFWLPAAGAAACLLLPVPTAAALVSGIVLALLLREIPAGATRAGAAHALLKLSVIGLGAGMNLGAVWRAGAQGIGYTVVSISLTLAAGLWLGRRARLPSDVSLLIATGTAICGGSAIAAVAGVVKPRHQDTTVAITTVFLLNAVALLIFPGIGHALGFSQRQFGLWAALAIHDTSSVVGAAMSYGRQSLTIATTVKLARALWIVPVAIAVGRSRRRPEEVRSGGRLPLPGFILGFLTMAALFSCVPGLAGLRPHVAAAAQRLFAVTLFLIGTGFSRDALRHVGVRPLAVGVVLWLGIGSATAWAIHAGWIH